MLAFTILVPQLFCSKTKTLLLNCIPILYPEGFMQERSI